MTTPGGKGRRPTLAELAKAKSLPPDFLQRLGLEDLAEGGVGIPYYGPTGETIAVKRRTALKAGDGSYWPKGLSLAAYGQWRLDYAAKAGILILVEGESDCWVLWHHGFPALGLPGAGTVKTLQKEHVEAVGTIYVHREPDQGGAMFVEGVRQRLAALHFQGKLFELRMPARLKDPADLHAADASGFNKRLETAILESLPLDLSAGLNGKSDREMAEPAGLATTCLATVRPVPVRWLVPGYLPLGKLILLAGDGGHGKSTLTLDLAACLTTGRPCLGLDHEPLQASDVLLISCEDDFADTVVLRLLSAGADLRRVHKVDGIKGKDGKTAPFSLAHFESMEAELLAHPEIRLVIIDPAGAYVGRSGVDDYNDSQLRSLLGPMAELAARREVTILLVKHLVKGATARAVHKVGGSAGYVNTVRAALAVAPDPEDPENKLLLPLKFNLGPRPCGLAYRMCTLEKPAQDKILDGYCQHLDEQDRERLAQQLFRIEWQGQVDADADRVLNEQARRQRDPNKVENCVAWLEKFLATHAFPSEEILAAAKEQGFTFDNVKEAKARLKEKGLRPSNRGRLGGNWWSGFGSPDLGKLRPDPPGTPHYPDTPQSPHYPHNGAGASRAAAEQGKVGSVRNEGSVGIPMVEEGVI
jgi:hypothetical protein